jgi:hypothetical protein
MEWIIYKYGSLLTSLLSVCYLTLSLTSGLLPFFSVFFLDNKENCETHPMFAECEMDRSV